MPSASGRVMPQVLAPLTTRLCNLLGAESIDEACTKGGKPHLRKTIEVKAQAFHMSLARTILTCILKKSSFSLLVKPSPPTHSSIHPPYGRRMWRRSVRP